MSHVRTPSEQPISHLTTSASDPEAEQPSAGETSPQPDNFKSPVLGTTKTDQMSQKEVDQLLSARALNFDGLTFTGKQFDYANFALGSFRGTRFDNCNLSEVTGKRAKLSVDIDFHKTSIQRGTAKHLKFERWRLIDTEFLEITLDDPEFRDCVIGAEVAGHLTFRKVVVNKGQFSNTNDGHFKECHHRDTTYDATKFTNVKFLNSIHFTTVFRNVAVFGGEWSGVTFDNNLVPPSRIQGGLFSNVKIISGNYRSIIIEPLGPQKPQFAGVEFVNTNFASAEINARFSEGFKVHGFSTDFSSINFKQSEFEEGTFGAENAGTRLNVKNSNFSDCKFGPGVKFVNCDLTGAKFPPNIPHVTFVPARGA